MTPSSTYFGFPALFFSWPIFCGKERGILPFLLCLRSQKESKPNTRLSGNKPRGPWIPSDFLVAAFKSCFPCVSYLIRVHGSACYIAPHHLKEVIEGINYLFSVRTGTRKSLRIGARSLNCCFCSVWFCLYFPPRLSPYFFHPSGDKQQSIRLHFFFTVVAARFACVFGKTTHLHTYAAEEG